MGLLGQQSDTIKTGLEKAPHYFLLRAREAANNARFMRNN